MWLNEKAPTRKWPLNFDFGVEGVFHIYERRYVDVLDIHPAKQRAATRTVVICLDLAESLCNGFCARSGLRPDRFRAFVYALVAACWKTASSRHHRDSEVKPVLLVVHSRRYDSTFEF